VRAILGQQISVSSASTLSGRLAKKFGTLITLPNLLLTHIFPSAEIMATLTPAKIANLGMPKTRGETLHRFACFAKEGGLDFPPCSTLDDVCTRLTSLKGIGDWTALYIAMRALRFPDAFPSGDLGLQKALGNIDSKSLEKRSHRWRPWRAYTVAHLWNSL